MSYWGDGTVCEVRGYRGVLKSDVVDIQIVA